MIKPKDRKHLDFAVWEKKFLKDPEIRAEYEKLQPEYAVIEAIIKARIQTGFTQKELAEKIGTKQSVISRLESGRANPSIGFLKKMATAMNLKFSIQLN